ncbi:unnamed protein product [Moneuplotes crassus]|uniref:Uncharacterized protein n=1 Tax=Euplotes crassus TaxID=5936 RepID=A0AAD1XJQ3_EUPCR|nr:unnamed protein product [Moneuplotes crassus]
MVGGGLLIIANPCDHTYINNPLFDDCFHDGFCDDMDLGCMDDFNIDYIAYLAEANVDIMGDPEVAEMGEELVTEDINEGLDINNDIALNKGMR